MNLSFFKTCFKITAIGNVLAAVVAFASIENHLQLFFGQTDASFLVKFYHYNLWAFVFLLGVAYWFLAKNPLELRIIALVGALGKLFFAASLAIAIISGQAKPFAWSGVVYDLFFGFVMAWFYLKSSGQSLVVSGQ